MSGAPVQGYDAMSGMIQIQNAQQMQGGRAQGRDANGTESLGEFGKLIEKATGLVETAKARAVSGAGTKLQFDAQSKQGGLASQDGRDAVRQVKDTADSRDTSQKLSADKQSDGAQTANSKEDNARVTDDNAESKLRGAADDAGRKVLSEVAEKLDVTEEDVEAAMEVLGLVAVELLDPANLTALVMEVSGETDPMVLTTDAELYDNLKELIADAGELTEELDIEPEQIFQFALDEKGEAIGAEIPGEAAAGGTADSDEAPVKVNMTKTGADGESVSVEVTVEDSGNVVAEQVSAQPAEHENRGGDGRERRGRGNGGDEAENHALNEDVINQLASRMNVEQPAFNEAVPVEEIETPVQQQMVDIVRQITEQIRISVTQDVTSMELTLHPASLGNVQLTVAQDAQGKMVAQFAVENETVRAAVESQLNTLQQRLDEQGVKIEAVEVTLASHSFESSMDGQQTGQDADRERDAQIRAAGPRGPRRINLGDLDEEELDDESRIAAEMMAANGNTVDYTA